MTRRMSPAWLAATAMLLCSSALAGNPHGSATEFCLRGEFDLSARLQGMHPAAGEFSEAEWCVITEVDTDRVHFRASGHSNPDLSGDFAVSYFPPDVVRIVNRASPPDLDFSGTTVSAEALRHRRIDPQRLVEEIIARAEWVTSTSGDGWHTVRYPGASTTVRVQITDKRLRALQTWADLPLRGRVPVHWNWDWSAATNPGLTFEVDGQVMFRARGEWRLLEAEDVTALWQPSGKEPPREIPGSAWPARTDMRLEELAESVYIVRGVRTGFHHIAIETGEGLVVGDAPAGWVELPQIPPSDLVPGLGISGLSEGLVDFLAEKLPDRPIRAVALTHPHDDHAGGARAFAAAGAEVYAPAGVRDFLQQALNREAMPPDRLGALEGEVTVRPVSGQVTLEGASPVELLEIGPGPHVSASLGVLAVPQRFFFQSDLHVPNSADGTPRADRVATECWFARWAVEHLPRDTVVVNSHSTVQTPLARLAEYLETPECGAFADSAGQG